MTTLNDYLDAGYHLADMEYQRGYVSRRVDIGKQPVLVAGGRRAGELYILEPCYTSSRFCFRHYLVKK